MSLTTTLLAAAFAVLSGANDGCPILATGVRVSRGRPIVIFLCLVGLVGLVPLLGFTNVATTFTSRMIRFPAQSQAEIVTMSIVAACITIAVLAVRGLPTSLTLALIGSMSAAAAAYGAQVSWRTIWIALLVAALAPVVSGILARVIAACWRSRSFGTSARNLHRLAFPAQAGAYAANDAQKMLALLLLAANGGGTWSTVGAPLATAALFGLGILLGWRTYVGKVSRSVAPLTPESAVVAEGSSAIAVSASAALGAPVSMTQSIMGALVGVGSRHTWRRVRWNAVSQLAVAWALTLPASAVFGLSIAWLGRVLR
jgi:PiT family inorganic phosphate transporter